MHIELTVNGELRSADVEPMTRLIDIIRNDLRLTGTKEGCGEGECGACSVIMDGRLVTSCLVPAIQAAGSSITTIEGIGTPERPSDLQVIFNEEGAIHCGFCTPGMIVAAHSLLERNPEPNDDEIRRELSGNICRCTGYGSICGAVARAASEGYGHRIEPAANLCKSRSPVFTEDEAGRYFAPKTLDEALRILNDHPGLLILSGCTDILVDTRSGRTTADRAIDIFGIPELHRIYKGDDGYIHIGGSVTNDELDNSPLINELLPALAYCARRCGGPAIQNRATVGGNLCTASGAGDLPVVLLAFDALVLLAGADGTTRMRTEDFVTGYRQTTLKPNQIVQEILIPLPAPGSRQAFFKRGSRKALTLSRVSLASYLELEQNRVRVLRFAAGSMSPIPRRLKRTEEALTGKTFDAALIERAGDLAAEEISPRKQTAYRKKITGNLVRRFFEEIVSKGS
ncbi:FAD binding domain-containing protein [uncultured Fretibacterium sp.]|uniref:FAD binding domain-containing protein n=1 Tax=uncultured Fretibacterium sp. TaxID=1678694 RepID=UPI0026162258|nr:FAD binding domain-containing protein [uncultured Fretibacterium sp.]